MCLIFTGLEPCAEHTYWCGPKFAIRFGFTGEIDTLAAENLILPKGKTNYIGTRPTPPNGWASLGSEIVSFPPSPCRACRLRTRGRSPITQRSRIARRDYGHYP